MQSNKSFLIIQNVQNKTPVKHVEIGLFGLITPDNNNSEGKSAGKSKVPRSKWLREEQSQKV